MPERIQHACRFLQHSDAIATLLAVVERNGVLTRAIGHALPPALATHCLHAALDGGALTLVTDSPVWASRLRFFGPELRRALAATYGPIATCRVRIQPQAAAPPPGGRAGDMPHLSAATVEHLIETAAGMKDEELAAALRRLAQVGGG